MSRVLLFSTSTCSWCRRAKRYFKERGVPFKEINIERDADAARDIVRKTGQTGVPVIKIGSRWIVGFDKEQIDKELARKASEDPGSSRSPDRYKAPSTSCEYPPSAGEAPATALIATVFVSARG